MEYRLLGELRPPRHTHIPFASMGMVHESIISTVRYPFRLIDACRLGDLDLGRVRGVLLPLLGHPMLGLNNRLCLLGRNSSMRVACHRYRVTRRSCNECQDPPSIRVHCSVSNRPCQASLLLQCPHLHGDNWHWLLSFRP